ncbi:PAS domain-containing sensor histidine kinase [Clostridium sp. 'White wine YQ']|uniref:PAS domain-containing sensor histidine kinase n=1 Tax=Clostridium sp. 'White wine YQ' TaxID=3027474 RepID=UPI00236634C6|nr:PAS domain-containing protein [Clostridium sp. 'White wine YQ']MDD7794193.1 PAS domain S-box protein [Clostridium sp. 'White wine YQ']
MVLEDMSTYLNSNLILENMFRNSNEIMLLIYPSTGKIIKANEVALRKYGYTSEQIANFSIYDISKDIKKKDEGQILRLLEEGKIFEDIHYCNNGEKFPVEVFPVKIGNEENNVVLIIIKDKSDEKKKEENLKNEHSMMEALDRSIFNEIPIGIFITNHNFIEALNKKAIELLGEVDRNNVITRKISEFISLNHREEFIKRVENFEVDKKPCFFETKILSEGHKRTQVECSINSLGEDKKIVVFKDITIRKNIEKKLSESERKYETLLGTLPDYIGVHSDGKIIFANENLAKLNGLNSPKDMIGREFKKIIDPKWYETIDARLKDLITHNSVLSPQTYSYDYNGTEIFLEVNSRKIIYDNEECVISVLRDVTDKIKLEELKLKMLEEKLLLEKTLEYDKIKTDFLSNISHELRTPLNIILSSVQVLGMYTDDEEKINIAKIKNYLKLMKQNCYRLLRLVNNFLDITKIDAGFYKLNKKNSDIINIVEEISSSVVEYLKGKNIELIFDTEVEEKIISCDEEKIERIILNLLSNAIKFTEAGGCIKVNIYDRISEIIISIKDTGCGIPEDKLQTIFDRFTQVESSLARKKEGSGIGLNLVKSLVEMHGGTIEVKSKLTKGTEFLVHLPVLIDASFHQVNIVNTKDYEFKKEKNIEKMNIEFSDIYSL